MNFSVAINCFNEELHIFNSIYSIYHLSNDIVIVNNNSTDGTHDEIIKFIDQYDTRNVITYIVETKTLPIHVARNKSLQLCKNDFIIKWDGDFINYNVGSCLKYIRECEIKHNNHFDLYLWCSPNFCYDIDHVDKKAPMTGTLGDQFISRKGAIEYYCGDRYPDSIRKTENCDRINYFLRDETLKHNRFTFLHWQKVKELSYFIIRDHWSILHMESPGELDDIIKLIEQKSGKPFEQLIIDYKQKLTKHKDEIMVRHNHDNLRRFLGKYNIEISTYLDSHAYTRIVATDFKGDMIHGLHHGCDMSPHVYVETVKIYRKAFFVQHSYAVNNFKHFTESLYILELFMKCSDSDKVLVVTDQMYVKLKRILLVLGVSDRNIIILKAHRKYIFKNITYLDKHNVEHIYSKEFTGYQFINTIIAKIRGDNRYNFKTHNKVYLTRGAYAKRNPRPLHTLDKILSREGYEVLEFTNQSNILEQIFTIHHASEIVCPIGAGVNNIFFKNAKCVFKCLIPADPAYRGWSNNYRYLPNYKSIQCGHLINLDEDIDDVFVGRDMQPLNRNWKFDPLFLIKKSKVAILKYGMSYGSYIHWRGDKNVNVNYDMFHKNHLTQFTSQFSMCDTFFTTRYFNDDKTEHLKKLLEPKDYYIYNLPGSSDIQLTDDKDMNRSLQLLKVIELCLLSSVEYDYVLLTRFDIEYHFGIDALDTCKINLVSEVTNTIPGDMEPGKNVRTFDDNFYFMPYQYLADFYYEYKSEFKKLTKGYIDENPPRAWNRRGLLGHTFINSFIDNLHLIEDGIKPVVDVRSFTLSTWLQNESEAVIKSHKNLIKGVDSK